MQPLADLLMYEQVMDNCPDEFWALDRKYCILAANRSLRKSMETALGIRLEAGTDIIAAFEERGLTTIAQYYQSLYDKAFLGESFMIEVNTPIEGKIFYREQYFTPLIREGEIYGVTIFSRDVTEKIERQLELRELLKGAQEFNEKLQVREEALSASEEELQQTNDELQRALDAFMEYDQMLRELQQQSGVGIFLCDAALQKVEYSDTFLSIHEAGADSKESTNLSLLLQGISGPKAEVIQKDLLLLSQEGIPLEASYVRHLPSGKKAWHRLVAIRMTAPKQSIIGFVFDITSFQQTKERLSFNEQKIQTILLASTDAIYDWDMVANTMEWNEGANRFYGLPADYKISIFDWEKMIHPEDLDKVVDSLDRATQDITVQQWNAEYRVVRVNGDIAYVTDLGCFVRDIEGKAVRMIGAMRDITEIRKYEFSLEEALEQERKLNEALASREEELASSEEELLQLNEHLRHSLERLAHREFLLTEAEHAARLGNWEFDLVSGSGSWSDNMFKIFGDEQRKDKVSIHYHLSFFEGKTLEKLRLAIEDCKQLGRAFDLELEAILPGNIKKWVRIYGKPVFTTLNTQTKQATTTDESNILPMQSAIYAIRGITQDISIYKDIDHRRI
jgi:PAS domain S-box-containing protein